MELPIGIVARERALIRDHKSWPVRGKLPRGYGFPVFGVMIPGDDRTIYEDDLTTVKNRYDSTEKLQEAGWLVD